MNLTTRIGPWTLADLCRTSHRSLDNTPPEEAVVDLRRVVELVAEPLIDVFGPMWVSSGYRAPAVNEACGGQPDSAHMYGAALDLVPLGYPHQAPPPVSAVVAWLKLHPEVLVDQAIDEHSSTSNWLHVGLPRPGRLYRQQYLIKRPGAAFKPI